MPGASKLPPGYTLLEAALERVYQRAEDEAARLGLSDDERVAFFRHLSVGFDSIAADEDLNREALTGVPV